VAENANQYRTIIGIVQFEPREAQAGGKDVRNITVRSVGVKEQSIRVSMTLWPSHEHVAVEEGDVVIAEGKFTVNKKDTDDGPKTYFNLSVSKILVLGSADAGKKVETVNDDSSDNVDDDDIPF
jgi:hypothetical protein